MNRIDRLLRDCSTLAVAQTRSLANLAHHFKISQRTVYCDVLTLNEIGTPVVSLLGQGYQLMKSYLLPPLVFTPTEAAALLHEGRMLATQARGTVATNTEPVLRRRQCITAASPHAGYLPPHPVTCPAPRSSYQ